MEEIHLFERSKWNMSITEYIPEGYALSSALSALSDTCEHCHQQFAVYVKANKYMDTPVIGWDDDDAPIYGELQEMARVEIITLCEPCQLAIGGKIDQRKGKPNLHQQTTLVRQQCKWLNSVIETVKKQKSTSNDVV